MKIDKKYRVFLVEDDHGTLQRMADIVSSQPDLLLVGKSETYFEASEWLNNHELDVLLTDLGLPDGNGKQLIEQTHKQHKQAEIMVISRFGDENSVVEAIKAGANGYLLKDESEEHIIDAIKQLLLGGSPISPAIASYILDYFQRDELSSSNTPESFNHETILTPKEKLVLQFISRGYSNKEIAASLEISPHTVASHIKNIYQKLQVNSRNEAVFEGWRMGELSMHEQNTQPQAMQKTPHQVVSALKQGGKSAKEIIEVSMLIFPLDLKQGVKILQQAEFSAGEIFVAVKKGFQSDDKDIIEQMLAVGFSHEEALEAMLDQV